MQQTILDLEKGSFGRVRVRGQYVEDATPALNLAEQGRRQEEQLRQNKRSEYKRMAVIPMTLALKIKAEHGVDPLRLRSKADTEKYLRVLQTYYPKFLTTNRSVYRRRSKIRFEVGTLERAR